MDNSDSCDARPLRLVLEDDSEERLSRKQQRQLQARHELNCAGCLLVALAYLALIAVAAAESYKLFLWLRY